MACTGRAVSNLTYGPVTLGETACATSMCPPHCPSPQLSAIWCVAMVPAANKQKCQPSRLSIQQRSKCVRIVHRSATRSRWRDGRRPYAAACFGLHTPEVTRSEDHSPPTQTSATGPCKESRCRPTTARVVTARTCPHAGQAAHSDALRANDECGSDVYELFSHVFASLQHAIAIMHCRRNTTKNHQYSDSI